MATTNPIDEYLTALGRPKPRAQTLAAAAETARHILVNPPQEKETAPR